MPSRPQSALMLSGLLSLAAIAVAIVLFAHAGCADASSCDDDAIAWVVGLPTGLLGVAMLAVAGFGWSTRPSALAQVSCIVWACVLLGAGAAIGGAASMFGIALACVAICMGALSVWVSG